MTGGECVSLSHTSNSDDNRERMESGLLNLSGKNGLQFTSYRF